MIRIDLRWKFIEQTRFAAAQNRLEQNGGEKMRPKYDEHYICDCPVCREPVMEWDDRYDIDGEIIHEDCLYAWAEKFLKRDG